MKSPFANLSKVQIDKLYNLLGVHIYTFRKGEEILPTIKGGNILAIILEGSGQIVNSDYNGNEIFMENLNKDSVFGTNISLTNSDDCNVISKENTKILVIDYNKLMNPENLKYKYFNVFFNNLFDIINSKYKETNERVKILEKKQIRDKLLEYFDIEYRKSRLNYFFLPFSFKELADYLAVNRSAMFRELKSLKDEHFIEINGRKITLLNAKSINLI